MSVYYNQQARYIRAAGNAEGLKQTLRNAADFVSGTDVQLLHQAADSVGGWGVPSERSIPATTAIRAMSIIGATPYPRSWDGGITFSNVPTGNDEGPPPAPEDEDEIVVDDDTSDDEIEQPPPPPPPPEAGFVFPGQ